MCRWNVVIPVLKRDLVQLQQDPSIVLNRRAGEGRKAYFGTRSRKAYLGIPRYKISALNRDHMLEEQDVISFLRR